MHTKRTRIFFIALLLIGCSSGDTRTTASTPECNASITGHLPREITEASGVAISHRNPGILWVHNDDAPAIVYAIDSTGTIHGRVRVTGVEEPLDFEDIAVAPCGRTFCMYIGDIGDNRHNRSKRAVYRIAEPAVTDTIAGPAESFPFDMGHHSDDAEALFVHRGVVYIITKGRRGAITLFRFPQPMRADDVAALIPVTTLSRGLVQLPDLVTGAGTTPDDKYIVIRTYSAMQLYTLDGDSLTPKLGNTFDLTPLHEPQGEGIDIRADGTSFLVSEKGFSDSAPPISRVQCKL